MNITEKTLAAREARARRVLARHDYQLKKSPSRHWTRAYYGEGYLVIQTWNNTVERGATTREYDATFEDVQNLVDDLIEKEAA